MFSEVLIDRYRHTFRSAEGCRGRYCTRVLREALGGMHLDGRMCAESRLSQLIRFLEFVTYLASLSGD